jgi:hypothetical protein
VALKQALTNLENNFASGTFDQEVNSLASGKKLQDNRKQNLMFKCHKEILRKYYFCIMFSTLCADNGGSDSSSNA